MKITEEQILKAAPRTDKARLKEFVEVFNEWGVVFGITTKARLVHFLAQCWHESGALRYVQEIASGRQYEGRRDLGNTQKGDGMRFKGRGFIQITGRANYKAYQESGFCVGDLMGHPERLAKKPGHTKASMWFWWKRGLNELADSDTGSLTQGEAVVKKITRRVNGGYNGLDDRLKNYRQFRNAIGI